jgi:hypothetical protein
MANGTTTFEDVARAAEGVQVARGAKGKPIEQFCNVWPMIKGVLQLAKMMFPKNVREKIDQAIPVCDALCAGGGGGT